MPVQLFVQLAAGDRIESVADFERTQAGARNPTRNGKQNALKEPAAPVSPRAGVNLRILLAVAALAALLAGAWLMRRRVR
ncbi:MAG TPA: hypothetical protein VGG67_00475 [Steroidobacteraceae bacterium]